MPDPTLDPAVIAQGPVGEAVIITGADHLDREERCIVFPTGPSIVPLVLGGQPPSLRRSRAQASGAYATGAIGVVVGAACYGEAGVWTVWPRTDRWVPLDPTPCIAGDWRHNGTTLVLVGARLLPAPRVVNHERRNSDGLVEVLEALGLPAADPAFLTRYLTDPLVHALVYLVRQIVTAVVEAGIIDRENDAQRAELALAAVSLDPVDMGQLAARWMAAMDAPAYAIDPADDRPPRPTPADVIAAVVIEDNEWDVTGAPVEVATEVIVRLADAGYRIVSTAR